MLTKSCVSNQGKLKIFEKWKQSESIEDTLKFLVVKYSVTIDFLLKKEEGRHMLSKFVGLQMPLSNS